MLRDYFPTKQEAEREVRELTQPEPETDWQAIEDNRLHEKGERP